MIDEAVKRLAIMFPTLRIMIAHGQMDGRHLDEAMESFSSGEADCLIATTIVESGLDIPNCNTIIIENVQFFGLASLYQLRGRVGRAGRQAYAYMFYTREHSELSPGAQERLNALEECCGLGEGFRLSERDMGIRGVGTMFGEKQSGDVDGIGADLYLELLFKQLQRIDHLRIKTIDADDVRVGSGGYEFSVTPFYIATPEASDEVQSTIDNITAHEEVNELLDLLKATFGELDESTMTCLLAREMRILAGSLGIQGIVLDNPSEPIIDFTTDASIMVKELLVEGISTHYDIEVTNTGLRLPIMTEMSIHSKVNYAVKVLRGITRSIPSFVKYL
jgi:transcription-repair coupling factor (superfamily II helicase)